MGVASAEHARAGLDGGFAQLGHGKHIAVKSLRKGDWIVYYSPREGMGEGETVQAFTTIGRVTSDAPYRAEQAMDFNPYRVDVDYLTDAKPAPIKPLLNGLQLTRDHVSNWGIVMRGPKRKLEEEDMRRIAEAMGVLADFENSQNWPSTGRAHPTPGGESGLNIFANDIKKIQVVDPPPLPQTSTSQELERLHNLLTQGAISQTEYEGLKAKLLGA